MIDPGLDTAMWSGWHVAGVSDGPRGDLPPAPIDPRR